MDIATLEPGALFKADGVYAVKTEYHLASGACECILLASGEFAYFSLGDATPVQEVIDLDQLRAEYARLRKALDEIDHQPVGAYEVDWSTMPEPCEACVEMHEIAEAALRATPAGAGE